MTRGRKKSEKTEQIPVPESEPIKEEHIINTNGEQITDEISCVDVDITNQTPTESDGTHDVDPDEPVKDDSELVETTEKVTSINNLGMREDYRTSVFARGNLKKQVSVRLLNRNKNDTDVLPPVFCTTRKNGQKVYFRLNVNSDVVIDAWSICSGKIDAETFISWVIDIYKLPAPKYYSDFKLISL